MPEDIDESIKKAIESLSEADLRRIAEKHTLENRQFQIQINSEAQTRKPGSEKSEYQHIVRESFKASADRHGFAGYWSAMRAVKGAETLLSNADQFVREARYAAAIPMYQAVFEEMVKSLSHADDSSGSIGQEIDRGLKGLESCAHGLKDPGAREILFDYLIKESAKKIYHSWDWGWDLIRISTALISNDRDLAIVIKALEHRGQDVSESDSQFTRDFTRERSLKIRCLALKQMGREEEFQRTVKENLDYPGIRRIAVEDAIKSGQVEDAKKLTADGIKIAVQKDFAGLVTEWKIMLLDLFKTENDVAKVIEYTRELFHRTDEFKYYEDLKQLYSSEEWGSYVQQLIKEISLHNPTSKVLGEIHVREKNWNALLAFVEAQSESIHTLRTYHKYLLNRYPGELSKMYKKAITQMADESKNQPEYVEVCQAIKKMKDCNVEDDVKELAAWIRRTLSRRPALLDELNKVVIDL